MEIRIKLNDQTFFLNNSFFWIKGIILSGFFGIMYLFFSTNTKNFVINNRFVSINIVNTLSLKYLWKSVGSVNIAILIFITALILVVIVHVILVYQNNIERDQHGR